MSVPERCTRVRFLSGVREQCVREFAHPGECGWGSDGARWRSCDVCARPVDPEVEGSTRFRHRGCVAPVPAQLVEIQERLRARLGVRS